MSEDAPRYNVTPIRPPADGARSANPLASLRSAEFQLVTVAASLANEGGASGLDRGAARAALQVAIETMQEAARALYPDGPCTRDGLYDERLYDAIDVALCAGVAIEVSPLPSSAVTTWWPPRGALQAAAVLVSEIADDLAEELPDRLDG